MFFRCGLSFLIVSLCVAQGRSERVVFDFDTGVDPNFSIYDKIAAGVDDFSGGDSKTPSGLWTIDDNGPSLRISKPADNRTIAPTGFLRAGIKSNFAVDGDFDIQVDFALHNWPANSKPQLNESALQVVGVGNENAGKNFMVFRLRWGSADIAQTYSTPLGRSINSSLMSGRYRLERLGPSVTASIAPMGGNSFTTLGIYEDFSGPVEIRAFAALGMNSGIRSATALDISFDNLIVEADEFLDYFANTPPRIPGDFDDNGILDNRDIDYLSREVRKQLQNTNRFDINRDNQVDDFDRLIWVTELANTFYGDANLDREFNSTDLVTVFQAGEYEDDTAENSSWAEGDWNGDGEFASSDLILAFQAGQYEAEAAVVAVPEPSAMVLLLLGLIALSRSRAQHPAQLTG